MITLYGIKNCDTMKKAFQWLKDHNIDYVFHDYKKTPPDTDILTRAMDCHGWENVMNRRGTTWRKLPDAVKDSTNADNALSLMMDHPSMIKRPILVKGDEILLGFNAETYTKALQ